MLSLRGTERRVKVKLSWYGCRARVLTWCLIMPVCLQGLVQAQSKAPANETPQPEAGGTVQTPASNTSPTESFQRTPYRENSAVASMSQTHTTFPFDGNPGMSRPVLSRGYLLQFRDKTAERALPNIVVYDATGKLYLQATVWFEGATKMAIRGAAMSPDGKVVVSAAAVRGQDRPSVRYLAKLNKAGNVTDTIDTADYLATNLCVQDNGDVWTIGFSMQELNDPSATVLRDWKFNKGLLHALLPRSTMERGFLNSWRLGTQSYLACNSQIIGIYSNNSQWIEVNSQTLKVTQWKIEGEPPVDGTGASPGRRTTGIAISDDGHVYGSFAERSAWVPAGVDLREENMRWTRRRGLQELTFDPETGAAAWVPIEGTVMGGWRPGHLERLLGVSGGSLIYTQIHEADSHGIVVSRATVSHP
jgi:hypothetical protein